MQKYFWSFIGALILVCVVLMVKFAFKPRVIPVVKPSSFPSPEEVGRVVHQQLQIYFKSKRIFLFGCPWTLAPESPCIAFMAGVAKDMERMGTALSHVYIPIPTSQADSVKSLFPQNTKIIPISEVESLTESQRAELGDPTQRSFFIGTHENSFRPNSQARIHALEKQLGAEIVAITIAPVRVFENENVSPSIPCNESESGLDVLGCAIEFQSRQAIKSRGIRREAWVAMFEQRGPLDFNLYLHGP